jgi:hypothetical protein
MNEMEKTTPLYAMAHVSPGGERFFAPTRDANHSWMFTRCDL